MCMCVCAYMEERGSEGSSLCVVPPGSYANRGFCVGEGSGRLLGRHGSSPSHLLRHSGLFPSWSRTEHNKLCDYSIIMIPPSLFPRASPRLASPPLPSPPSPPIYITRFAGILLTHELSQVFSCTCHRMDWSRGRFASPSVKQQQCASASWLCASAS